MTDPDSSRWVPFSAIEEYIDKGIDGTITVEGTPDALLLIQPSRRRMGIDLPATDPVPDVNELARVHLDLIDQQGTMRQHLFIAFDDNARDVYAVLKSVVDRIQLLKVPPAEAVEQTLSSLGSVLSLRRGLTRDQQVGLFGELLVLLGLAKDAGPAQALAAWRGPSGEEHDFGTSQADLEVKTTVSEERRHWISSATQLAPTPPRPLFLVSVQLTVAGADSGASLPELIGRARSTFAGAAVELEHSLVEQAYRDTDADLYDSRWALRSAPAFYLVDESFPAITRDALDRSVPTPERVLEIRYRINLNNLNAAPSHFDIVLEEGAPQP